MLINIKMKRISLKNILNKLLAVICLTLSMPVGAVNVIRDSEIEHAIDEVISPLIKASGITRLKIHILSDNTINAFTAGGNEIFVNSGLIVTFPDVDVFRGVIAHEMGHVLGHHVFRQIENLETGQITSMSAMAIGLVGALAGAPVIGLGAMASGMNYADSSVLHSSRVYESSADQAGLMLLEKSGNTSTGLLKLLDYLNRNTNSFFTNRYEMTHPLSSDRIIAVENFIRKSKFKNSQTSERENRDFKRAAFKLYAFTTPLSEKALIKSGSEEIDTYVAAIISMRLGKLTESMTHIDRLISVRPEDPYYHELKGQILFGFGKKECLASYQKAVALLPGDALLRISRAVVILNIDSKNPVFYPQIIEDLKFAQRKEPDNLMPYYFLSVVYDKAGDRGRSTLNNAIFLFKQGKLKDAQMMAKIAVKNLQPDTPDWNKANDIILTDR